MRKLSMTLMAGVLALPMWAGVPPLGGFFYGNMEAPTGWEWQSPDSVAYNKQQPHAWFFSFANTDEARRVLPENSSLWQSLDGKWKFHWASNPSERPVDFYKTDYDVAAWDDVTVPMNWNLAGMKSDGTYKYGKPIYVNQKVIFQHSVRVGDWKGGVMRTPPQNWLTYTDRNEVGSYRRSFTVPAAWKGKEIYLNFDGVDSFFYLYINGRYVGFSKNSRNLAQFDITPYLNDKGENIVAVEVYRNSDASFLEAQDMFRLPGIFRSVSLTAKPKVQVRDIKAIPDYDATFTDASLAITAEVSNLSGKKQKGLQIHYSLYENTLYGDDNKLVQGVSAVAQVDAMDKTGDATAHVVLHAGKGVKPWSAEAPHRYTLVGELKDAKGRVIETFSTIVGFRKIEIKETAAKDDEFGLAGRYYYLNGKPIKMKGVNRHENNPKTGHYVTRQQMEHEVFLMKQGNINHVRNCHYPDAPYWYYLCDKYGIYLEDEANIESHEYYYGEASLSHVPEFLNAHIARNMEMVHATINNPSVCIWSLGNEAGPGQNFVECYKAIKAYDTSRPVQYERNNDIVDMGSNQYPSPAWVAAVARGNGGVKYPFHISEYAHSMGNAVGNLVDYWNAMESTNFFIGGAIWDWVDQAIDGYVPGTGKTYWGYGGDFGMDNKPNDGMFCMNGIMRPDLSPKAQYFEVKKVYQNVGVSMTNAAKAEIEVFNKNYFEPLTDYNVFYSLWQDGEQVGELKPVPGNISRLAARQRQKVQLPIDMSSLNPESEYFVKVLFAQAADKPWAEKGYIQMEEQMPLAAPTAKAPALATLQQGKAALATKREGDALTIGNDGFQVKFDMASGAIAGLSYGGLDVIVPGKGPKLDAFRAPTDNDAGAGYDGPWFSNGLYNLQHKALDSSVQTLPNGNVQVVFTVESQGKEGCRQVYGNGNRDPQSAYRFDQGVRQLGPNDFKFTTVQVYTVYPDGSVELQSNISSNNPSLLLPRIGYSLELPKAFSQYDYYGRGPVNNYNDRRTASFIEHYRTTVDKADIMLPKPQSMGNREEVRWCALTNPAGRGVLFIADGQMSTSALPWTQRQLAEAPHPYQLPQSTSTVLHLDAKVTGLGGASCGQGGPLRPDRAYASDRNFGFIIRPINIGRAAPSIIGQHAHVSGSGEQPFGISRDRVGKVTLTAPQAGRQMMYRINGAKRAVAYTKPFDLRAGGTLEVWYKDNPTLKVTRSYEAITSVPLEVVFVSSFEPGEGAERVVDGDPGTIWHTAYGVTVTKYPHWIDFDAAEVKNMKGFTYLPRQNGPNGRIKDYEIYVSMDGENWGEPVCKGAFPASTSEQKVMFAKPVKARYIRFKALSALNGGDFASTAEFSLIGD